MTKKNALTLQEDDVFNFDEMLDESAFDEETMMGAMGSMLDASNNQMMIALELTKLIVTNNPVKNIEDHVFTVFKKATKVVGENFALKNIMEQMEQTEE